MSDDLIRQKARERHFMEQLLDSRKLENYKIPVPIKAELRKYQQVCVYMAFFFFMCVYVRICILWVLEFYQQLVGPILAIFIIYRLTALDYRCSRDRLYSVSALCLLCQAAASYLSSRSL